MTRYVLGVDGGGTKTDAVIADEYGRVISTASSGGANWERLGIERALSSLDEVIRNAAKSAGIKTSQIESASLAIAGIDWPEDVYLYLPITDRLGITNFQMMNDSYAALYAGAGMLEGIVSIAGTGGKTAGIYGGKEAHTMGMELGEGGGAGQLVGLALEYIAMQHHKTAAPSALYQIIPQLMGKEPGTDFFKAVARSGLKLHESIAPEIFNLTEVGDPGAMYAVTRTATQHANDVIGIAKQLGITRQTIKIVKAGGLHTAGNKIFDSEFEAIILRYLTGATLKILIDAPVMGAVNKAIGGLNG